MVKVNTLKFSLIFCKTLFLFDSRARFFHSFLTNSLLNSWTLFLREIRTLFFKFFRTLRLVFTNSFQNNDLLFKYIFKAFPWASSTSFLTFMLNKWKLSFLLFTREQLVLLTVTQEVSGTFLHFLSVDLSMTVRHMSSVTVLQTFFFMVSHSDTGTVEHSWSSTSEQASSSIVEHCSSLTKIRPSKWCGSRNWISIRI